MPEMTPERIESLAQSARDRDPNPAPLDKDEPQGLLSAKVLRPVGEIDHIDKIEEYEVTGGDHLVIRCTDEDIVYASGSWSSVRVLGGAR